MVSCLAGTILDVVHQAHDCPLEEREPALTDAGNAIKRYPNGKAPSKRLQSWELPASVFDV